MRISIAQALPLIPGLILAQFLTACNTPNWRAEHAQAALTQRTAVHGPTCVRMGHAAESAAWKQCIAERAAHAELDALSGYHTAWRTGAL